MNGQIAFPTGRGGEDVDLFAISSDGTFARPLAVGPGRDFQPVWSPDGRQFAWANNATGKRQIRIADADGRNVRRFVQSNAVDFAPAWSPDGRKLLFISERTGSTEIYVANADSSDVRQLTSQRALAEQRPNWSPDGTQIAWDLLERNPLKNHIYVMNADGSNQRRLVPNRTTNTGDHSPNWSPDGRKILWLSFGNGGDGGEIWVANADGSNPQMIVELKRPLEIRSAVWSPDGKFIAYTAPFASGKLPEVWVVRADGTGASSIIGIAKTQFSPAIDWQPVADRGAQPSSLLRSGGAEDGFGGNFVGVDYPVSGWETNGGLTALRYGLPGFPNPPSNLPAIEAANKAQKIFPRGGAGKRFFFGGNQAVSTATQIVSLSAPVAELDTGRAKVTLSGLLGGKGAEADEGTAVASFLNAQNTQIGVVAIGPVTPAERNNQTTFIRKLQTATLPAGTRRIRVTLTATRRAGQTNDAYFENLALTYSKPEAQAPTTPPTPVQPPATPPPGVTGNGPNVSGRVSNLRISPTPFAASGKNTAAVAQRGRRAPRGASVRYRLDRATVVTLEIARRGAGRRDTRGRCVKTTSANRNRKRCTRTVPVGTLLRFGREGTNTFRFTGRLSRKALKSGSYRLTASASNRVSTRFRIVKR